MTELISKRKKKEENERRRQSKMSDWTNVQKQQDVWKKNDWTNY